ncbi:hypothetical protein BGX34_002272 [Mortierella sp. NVP85]|nr:hypothetical protein BGX34_002272 [Mortierella sp. NVP85]
MNGEGHQSTDDSDSDPKNNASGINDEDVDHHNEGPENDYQNKALATGTDPSMKDWVPSINYTFECIDDAQTWLRSWARLNGFKMRLRDSKPNGNPPSFKFVCHLQGTHTPQKISDTSKQHNKAASKRCDCPFFINLSSPRTIRPKFRINSFNCNHNDHDMDYTLADYSTLTQSMLATIMKCAVLEQNFKTTMRFLDYEHPGMRFDEAEVARRHRLYRDQAPPKLVSQSVQLMMMLMKNRLSDVINQDGWYYPLSYLQNKSRAETQTSKTGPG